MSEVAYEDDVFLDDDDEDELESESDSEKISDGEFRDMVKKTSVDVLLCVFNIWRSTQVIHDDFVQIMERIRTVDELGQRLEQIEKKVSRPVQPKIDKRPEMVRTGMMAAIIVLQLVTILALALMR